MPARSETSTDANANPAPILLTKEISSWIKKITKKKIAKCAGRIGPYLIRRSASPKNNSQNWGRDRWLIEKIKTELGSVKTPQLG